MRLARLLDRAIPLPGNLRIGLDGLIGLIPGIGDAVGALLGFYIVSRASALGLPKAVLARMLLNLGIDTLVGAVPFLGDLFDFAFKANTRNLQLFRRHALDPGASTTGDQAFFVGLIVLVIGILWLLLELAARLLSALAGAF